MNILPNMPEGARVWIYQANRFLDENEVLTTNKLLTEFTKNWTAHDLALRADFAILLNRFIVLAVDEAMHKASGCSIDKSTAILKKIEADFSVNLFDRGTLCFFDAKNEIFSCKIADLKAKIAAGEITSETIFFDNTVANLADLRMRWQVKAQNSWLNRYFATKPASVLD